MSGDEVICRDLFLKHFNANGKLETIRQYRVWDGDRKLQSESAMATANGGRVEIATFAEYLEFKDA